jgi:hypothetical protein
MVFCVLLSIPEGYEPIVLVAVSRVEPSPVMCEESLDHVSAPDSVPLCDWSCIQVSAHVDVVNDSPWEAPSSTRSVDSMGVPDVSLSRWDSTEAAPAPATIVTASRPATTFAAGTVRSGESA